MPGTCPDMSARSPECKVGSAPTTTRGSAASTARILIAKRCGKTSRYWIIESTVGPLALLRTAGVPLIERTTRPKRNRLSLSISCSLCSNNNHWPASWNCFFKRGSS
jgi:hypothetical protein